MPRGPRRQHGGPRQGQPGQNYTNRTDMQAGQRAQAVRTATGLPYGQAGQLQAAQQQVPLPGPPAVPTGGGSSPTGAPAAGPWNRPTERPGEPVTTGITAGPGAGPEALQTQIGGPDIGAQLRGLMLAFPESDQIRRLVTAYDARQSQGRTGGVNPYLHMKDYGALTEGWNTEGDAVVPTTPYLINKPSVVDRRPGARATGLPRGATPPAV